MQKIRKRKKKRETGGCKCKHRQVDERIDKQKRLHTYRQTDRQTHRPKGRNIETGWGRG